MNIKDYLDVLILTGLFDEFSAKELLNFFRAHNFIIAKYNKNSIIHFESEKCNYCDIILKGQVLVQKIDEKGNVLTVAEFKIGDSMGGNLLFSNYPYYPMSVIAKSDTEILHIPKDVMLQLCQTSQDFLVKFLTSISDKTAILTSKIKSISMKSIRESIIEFLNYEYYTQKRNKIKLNITKKELAERLGIQRTSLSRELNKMKKDGLIDYNAHSITICDFHIIRKL
ncbi:transcriptional regulator [Fervidicella metallireducens AeB]|uniref:Transcriptional regulator n=1 Tax=Fervidicella metallireducens AeB TaxID=1403537 RepID=A0A017RRN7_9CLOT|nr:Crp/Fnr family transcriptional regulator [Fervidicella metallireducens]EYE87266.1 transcriptional regulator [Fervidicella metallireducens AeB]